MNDPLLTVAPAPSVGKRRSDLGLQKARRGRADRWINASKGVNEKEQSIDLQFVDGIDIDRAVDR